MKESQCSKCFHHTERVERTAYFKRTGRIFYTCWSRKGKMYKSRREYLSTTPVEGCDGFDLSPQFQEEVERLGRKF